MIKSLPPLLVAAALVVALSPARSANVPPEMVALNEKMCVELNSRPETKSLDKLAPSDAAKIPGYCHCYSKAYWDSVPQADYDGMMAEHKAGETKGPHSLALRAALKERNEAAKKSCR